MTRRLGPLTPALIPALLLPLLSAPPAGAAEPAPQATAKSSLVAAFTLVAPPSVAASQLVTRAVTTGGACPTLDVTYSNKSKKSLPMSVRSRPGNTGSYFTDVKVCSRAVPSTTKSASVSGRRVPATLSSNIRRMALFADTGCRISEYKGNYEVQRCDQPNDPTRGWPLNSIAKAIAADKPDVILNPGDYFYREADCPVGLFTWAQAACGTSPDVPVSGYPFKDSAAGWRADVFTPMAPLFPVAPIAMLRGNHEACDRGGNGFFYFLDPRPTTSNTCAPVIVNGQRQAPGPATTATWSATLDLIQGRSLKIAMVDSAYGNDLAVTPWAKTQQASYASAAAQTKPTAGQESWLLTHRPVIGHNSRWTSADQTAAAQGLLDNYNLVLSSHIHFTQAIKIPTLPPSLIMGNGGTSLDRNPGTMTTPLQSQGTMYQMATTDWTVARWGYAIATAGSQSRQWTITHKDQNGSPFAKCALKSRTMTCS